MVSIALRRCAVLGVLISLSICAYAQESYRASANPAWEKGYLNRLQEFLDANKMYKLQNGSAYPDVGKRAWPYFLSNLYKLEGDKERQKSMIATDGLKLASSKFAATLSRPFSLPGYTMYYLQYKDLIPEGQLKIMQDTIDSSWKYLSRDDRKMDPIYYDSEFNSENYHWMSKMGGLLLAYDRKNASMMRYYDTFADNWIRALYNKGRIEWNSNNYWGHCFTPTLVLYHHAPTPKIKRQAKAGLDWLMAEAMLHYLDGFYAAGDVRAKSNAYKPFAGSVWGAAYLYFADENNLPTYYKPSMFKHVPKKKGEKRKKPFELKHYTGYNVYSDYRPLQVMIDIAQRKFPLPVEVHSAKPYYHLDNDNYADWQYPTERSRKYEFETLYMDENYSLVSLASNRPDGANRCKQHMCYSEESLWRLIAKGTDAGAVQIAGNTGHFKTPAGRDPYEEIAQFRNVMLRVTKNTSMLWVIVPRQLELVHGKERVFVDMGSGVYAAFTPFASDGKQTEIWDRDENMNIIRWFYSGGLSALSLEVGTQKEFGSFQKFQEAIKEKTRLQRFGAQKVRHVSAQGNTLDLEYVEPTVYKMAMGCIVNPAGVTPNAYANDKKIDYKKWHSYETVHGFKIIEQKWGSGVMKLKSSEHSLKIKVNSKSADVEWVSE